MPNIQLQFRRGTAAQWTSANTVLASGEMGIETDTALFKVGNGVTAWNSLPYGGVKGPTGPSVTGPTGSVGSFGSQGPTGPSGSSGYSGTSGRSGYSGTSGRSGYSGIGTSGYSGIGTSGYSGVVGFSGYSGDPNGQSGYSGVNGASGYSGVVGFSGYSGVGTSGYSGVVPSAYKGTYAYDFGSIGAGASAEASFTVTGAAVGDPIALGNDQPNANLTYMAYVSSADTVTIRATNPTASPVDPGSSTFKCLVFSYAAW